MPNLTGDFDVVVEVAVPALNRVLAAIHQNQAPDRHPSFLHSLSARVDLNPAGVGRVSGIAQVQVSTPSVSLPMDPGATRVTVDYQVMVRFISDTASPGTASPVPEFIHGDLQVTGDLNRVASQAGNQIVLYFDGNDLDVHFVPTPGSGLSSDETRTLERLIHDFLRSGMEPVNEIVNLPDGPAFAVHYVQFKTMSAGRLAAVALLVNVRSAVPANPAEARGSAATLFLADGDSFAIGVGRDFVVPVLQQAIAGSSAAAGWDVSGIPYHVSPDLSSLRVDLHDGEIVVDIDGRATSTLFFLPNLVFTVHVAVSLRVAANTIVVSLVNRPDNPQLTVRDGIIGTIAGIFSPLIRPRLRSALQDALVGVGDQIRARLGGGLLSAVLAQLGLTDARLAYTGVDVRRDGLALHVALDTGAWNRAVATFLESDLADRIELNALYSWIPGGTVERYTWVAGDGSVPRITEEHQFVADAPLDPATGPRRWCLQTEGTQMTARGVPGHVTSTACSVDSPIMDALRIYLAGLYRLPLGVIGPDPAPRALAIIDALRVGAEWQSTGTNVLVHFAEEGSSTETPAFSDLIGSSIIGDSAVVAVEVHPADVPEQGVKPPAAKNALILRTRDRDDAWRRAFQVKDTPVTYLVDASGRLVWQQTGRLDVDAFMAALNEHLVPGGRLTRGQLRLNLHEGDSAPDFLFDYVEDRQVAFRKLRAPQVLLNFWTTWAEPCLTELLFLQQLLAGSPDKALIVLAINDGEPPERAREFFKAHGLTLRLVIDPESRISNAYGVCCWPTTVSVGANGMISGIQYGVTLEQQANEPSIVP